MKPTKDEIFERRAAPEGILVLQAGMEYRIDKCYDKTHSDQN
jgi:hypothetical protein